MKTASFGPRAYWAFWALVAIAVAGTAAAVRWYYVSERDAMTSEAIQELSVVADAERKEIAAWRTERIGDGRVLLSPPAIGALEQALSSREVNPANRAEILSLMAALQQASGYSNAFLVDTAGSVQVRLHQDDIQQTQLTKPELAKLSSQALEAGDVLLSDLDQFNGRRRVITLTVPVRRLGSMILVIDPSTFLYPLLRGWPGPSRTGETMLLRLDGPEVVYLSGRRYAEGQPNRRKLNFRPPTDDALDRGTVLRGPDYRGVLVLMEARRVPDSPWYVAAKIDVSEVNAPIARLGREMAFILLSLGLAIAAGAAWAQKSRQLRLQHESEALFRAIADDTPAFLWMASPADGSSFINQPFQRFLGAKQREVGISAEFLHPDDAERALSRFQAAVERQERYADTFRLRRFDGEYRSCIGEALPRFSTAGRFIGFAGCVIDITQLKEAERKLTLANAELSQELAEKTRREAEIRALSARLIHAQEEERTRISRELHDDLSQQIAALSIAMGRLKLGLPEQQAEARAQTDRMQTKLVELSEAIRRLSHQLHPAILQHFGLIAALREYCREFSSLTRIQTDLRTRGEFGDPPPAVALNIYRIVQEGLRNVAKHAKADLAEIELVESSEGLRLTISDRGVGIAEQDLGSSAGLGLASIRERAKLVNGVMDLRSSPQEGTTLTITIPFSSERDRWPPETVAEGSLEDSLLAELPSAEV